MSMNDIFKLLAEGTVGTLYMTLVSSLIAYVIGLPLGLVLVVTGKEGIKPNPWINTSLGIIVNILRSVPFLILLVALMPFTRLIVGTSLGSKATIVPLVIASAPYVARLVESSIQEVDAGVIEAAKSMGASTLQIVCKVLIPEAMPALLTGSAIAVTTILGYSAMAGIVGGGGLGDIAIRYGYQRKETVVMLIMVAALVIIVQVLQEIGMKANKIKDKRNQ
jgi:D-methionine transport system permease protein